MQLPQLSNNGKVNSYVPLSKFGGLNLNYFVNEGEWSDAKNMTNDYFPVFANRKKRGYITTLTAPQGFCGGKCIAWVDDDKFYYDQVYVCDLDATGKKRKMCTMGSYVCIFPDGLIYNTVDGSIEYVKNTTEATGVVIGMCNADGSISYDSTNTVVSASAPSDTSKYWLDTSSTTAVLKIYNSNSSSWTSVGTTYAKFTGTGIGTGFAEYDAVHFSGVDTGSWIYNGYDFNTDNIIYGCGDDYLIVAGLINLTHTNSGKITFERRLPTLDYVVEMDNRIWGCSSDDHEIYACKQGDPKNWYFYGGFVSDSYAATVGTQNNFTGIATYGGYMYFFKEDGYHKLYGSKPSNYEMVWKPGHGVQTNSGESISIVNEMMLLKGRDGFYIYDGSMNNINGNLGTDTLYDAVGAGFRNKYYVSARDANYTYHIYVYDTEKGLWTMEDEMKACYMATCNDGLFMVDANTGKVWVTNTEAIYTKIFPQRTELGDTYLYPGDSFYPGNVVGGTLEDTIEWGFETGDIDLGSIDQKYVKRIIFRVWLDVSSKLKIEIEYDSSGEWIDAIEYYCNRKRSYEIPVVVQRNDHMRIRFSGFGNMRLYSLTKVVEEGSATTTT